jgi:hypothetical protein
MKFMNFNFLETFNIDQTDKETFAFVWWAKNTYAHFKHKFAVFKKELLTDFLCLNETIIFWETYTCLVIC